MVKLKWKVAEAPTGKYRSFQSRSWPHAYYKNKQESPAVMISCTDEYRPARARGEVPHDPLTIYIADHSTPTWKWRKLIKTAATLDEAKALAVDFLTRHPEYAPKEDNNAAP